MTLRKKDQVMEGIHITAKNAAERINMRSIVWQYDECVRENEQKISDQSV
jgi:hypothetical protein